MHRPMILAETPHCRIYQCGSCGDLHVELGTVSMRVDRRALRGLLEGLQAVRPCDIASTDKRPYARRAIALTVSGSAPFQIVLHRGELRDAICATTAALRLLALSCPCALALRRN